MVQDLLKEEPVITVFINGLVIAPSGYQDNSIVISTGGGISVINFL